MARRAPALLALLAVLVLCTGCGGEARVGVANVQAAGVFLSQEGADELSRAVGRSVAMQAGATLEQMNLRAWGLLPSRVTKPSVTAQDWKDSPVSSERRSTEQAKKIEAETAQIQAISGGFMQSLGLSVGWLDGGAMALLFAWLYKNQGTIRSLVAYGANMRKAETEEDAKAVEEANPVANKVIAKAKTAGKVS